MPPNGNDRHSDPVRDADSPHARDPEMAAARDRSNTSLFSSPLETLPAELRNEILRNVSDLETLRSLVHASPVMHAQYRRNRDMVLRGFMGRELDGFFVDAYARLMSRLDTLGPVRTDDKITGFLEAYRGWLSASSPCPNVNQVHSSYLRWMAAFHLSVARPLARQYSTWALSNLASGASSSGTHDAGDPEATVGDQHFTLSRSEDIRIFRALYRYETFCHLFDRSPAIRRGGFPHYEINDIFFGLFDPWEAEAVGCIDLFMRHSYAAIFAEVEADLHPGNEKFRQPNGVFNPEGSIDLKVEYDDYMNGTVGRGLKMLARLLAITHHETLVTEMERCFTRHPNMDATMRGVLSLEAQHDRRGMSIAFNARDEAELRRDAVQFDGDAVPPDGPPLGWVLLWNETYSNLIGEYVPDTVKEWGYVMWDERRWIELGAEDLVYQQWDRRPDMVEIIGNLYGWAPADY